MPTANPPDERSRADHLSLIEAAHARKEQARREMESATAELNDRIYEAMEHGQIIAKPIREITGLTLARIYQIRDRELARRI